MGPFSYVSKLKLRDKETAGLIDPSATVQQLKQRTQEGVQSAGASVPATAELLELR